MGGPQPVEVVHRVDHERAGDVDRALERDRRHAPAGRAEPTLLHSAIVSPGAGHEQLDAGRQQRPQRVGRPGEQRERAVVRGDDARGADELGRDAPPPRAPS